MNIFKNDLTTNAFYFKLGYLILCLLGTVAFIQPYSDNLFKVVLLYGALILLIDLVTKRELFKSSYFIYQFAFIFFMGLSILVNWDKGLIANIKVLAYTVTQVFLLTFIGENKEDGYAEKELLFFSRIIIVFFTIYMTLSVLMYFFNIHGDLLVNNNLIYFGITPFGRFNGLSMNANLLGICSSILILLTLISFRKNYKVFSVFSIVMGFICLVMSESLGAKISLIVFLIFFLFFKIYGIKKRRMITNIVLFFLIGIVSISFIQVGDGILKKTLNVLPTIHIDLKREEIIENSKEVITDEMLDEKKGVVFEREISSSFHSGRMDLWRVGLKVSKDNFIFGVGDDIAMEKLIEYDEKLERFAGLASLHNILIDILVKYGIFSLISFAIFAFRIIFNSFNRVFVQGKYKKMYLYTFSIITSLFAYNMLEVNILFSRSIISFLFCISLGFIMNEDFFNNRKI